MKNPAERAENLVKALHSKIPLLHIGGMGVESDGNATIQICNPADGSPIGRCPAANAKDVERATRAARRAFDDTWAEYPPSERANILWRAADLLEREAHDLAVLESLQTGKTFREALTSDVTAAINALRYYAGWVNKRAGEIYDLGGGFVGYGHVEPMPVVGAIISWYFPLASAVWKIAPALAGGSTVVLKPSELTPLTALRLAELMVDAGLPPGVLNVVTGFGHQAGEALAQSPDVQALSFTGSIESARRILLSSAKSNLKRVHLSLGGKGANILFQDANLQRAVSAAWKAIFSARGEVPWAGSRLLVHASLYEEVAGKIADRAREILIGDPLDEHTEMGPLISEPQLKKTLAYVELGRREGARLVAGGTRDVEGTKSAGYFVKPTVFMDVTPTMRIFKEEIFGPVLSILPFEDEEEAVALANGTDYGLANAVWTADLARAHRVARKLQAGVVWINHHDHLDPALPLGGTGLSGHGRDLGRAGLDQFSQTKAIYLPSR
jgi:acyl-CoA reductase-like NAD-dependent aldehyde dehydrogenase